MSLFNFSHRLSKYSKEFCKERISKDEAIKLVKQAIKKMSYSQRRVQVKVNGYYIALVSIPENWKKDVTDARNHPRVKHYIEESEESLIKRIENLYVIELPLYVIPPYGDVMDVEIVYSDDIKDEFEKALDENRYLFVVLCPVRKSPYSNEIKYHVLSNFVTLRELGLRKNAEEILSALKYIENLKSIITACIDQELDKMFKQALSINEA